MTRTYNNIEQQFISRGIVKSNMLFLDRATAIEFAKMVRLQNGKLLGFDGFFLTENSTQPSMEHSRDYSSSSTDGVDEAIDFLSNPELDDMFFEMVTSIDE